MQGATSDTEANLARQREIVDAFLATSRSGDLERLRQTKLEILGS